MAYVISTLGVGGAERFLGALVKEGDRRGWEQVVLNPFANPAAVDELTALVAPARYVPLPCGSVLGVPALRRRLRKELDEFGPDLLHAMLWHALVLVATMRRRPGERRVLTHMYGEGIRLDRRRSNRVRTALDRWAGRRFDLVIAISEGVRRFLLTEHGYTAEKVTSIPLGWEGEPRPPSTEPRPPTVVCVALYRPEKGHDILLDAFALVRREVPDARLVLVGRGALQAHIEARARELGLDDAVDVTGPVPEVWSHLARADVFALASTSEAFGIAIVEAMAAGLPVVASDVGGIPELVDVGVTGELFPPGDRAALAGHLVRLLTDAGLRARMSVAARAAAAPRHLRQTLPRYFDACDELLQAR